MSHPAPARPGPVLPALQWLRMVLVLVWSLWGLPGVVHAAESVVSVTVTTPEAVAPEAVEARARWLGSVASAVLEPASMEDGTVRWSGTLAGAPVRLLPVEVWVRQGAVQRRAYASVEVLSADGGTLSYAVDELRPGALHRVAGVGAVAAVRSRDALWRSGSFLWGTLLMVGVLALRRVRPERLDRAAIDPGRWEPLLWLGLAVAWTWPAALAGGDVLVGRHFDAPGTIWFLDAAQRLVPDLVDPLTGWPDGARYATADSFTLVLVGAVSSWMDPVRVHGWLQVLGVAASAWAASGFARAVGARPPWTLLAGMGFAFSGLAANALLEGHAYHVANPWMPLFGLAWWKATGPRGTPLHGVGAGVAFLLTLLTTGYLGLAAAILAVGFLADGLWREGRGVVPPALASAVVVVPALVVYVALFATGAEGVEATSSLQLHEGSLGLASFGGPSPELDRSGHSLALALPGVSLVLVLCAGSVLRRVPRWRVLVGVSVAALVVAALPHLVGATDGGGSGSTLASVLQRIRFPVRLVWAALLCGGVLAARVATELLAGRAGAGRVVLGVALLEAFVVVGLPWRQQTRVASTPSAYAHGSGPVFELVPTVPLARGDLESWLTATACLHQTGHGRAIAEDCVRVPIDPVVDRARSRWVGARLLEGASDAVVTRLVGEGFGSIAVQPDLLAPGDWARIEGTLARIDPNAVETLDGGTRMVVVDLAAASTATPPDPVPAGPDADTLVLQVVTARGWRPGELEALVSVPGGDPVRHRFHDDAGLAADRADDGIWSVELAGPVSSSARLALVGRRSGREEVLWSGPVRATGTHDHRLFYEEPDGTVQPVLFALEQTAPGAGATGGRTVWVSALVFVLMGLLVVIDDRRWRTPRR